MFSFCDDFTCSERVTVQMACSLHAWMDINFLLSMAIAWVRTCDHGKSHTVLCRKHFRFCLSLSEDGWKNKVEQQYSRDMGRIYIIIDINRFNLYRMGITTRTTQ